MANAGWRGLLPGGFDYWYRFGSRRVLQPVATEMRNGRPDSPAAAVGPVLSLLNCCAAPITSVLYSTQSLISTLFPERIMFRPALQFLPILALTGPTYAEPAAPLGALAK